MDNINTEMEANPQPEQVDYRSKLRERYSSQHPDMDFSDDKSLDSMAFDELSKYDSDRERYSKMEEDSNKMKELFNKDPRYAATLNELASGADPFSYLIENFGDDFLDALESEEGKENFLSAHKKWLEKTAADEAAVAERSANFDKSLVELEKFGEENGLDDEQKEKIFLCLNDIATRAINGEYNADDMKLAMMALNHDTDVQNARNEGVIDGRNEKIDAKLRSSRDNQQVPNLSGQGAPVQEYEHPKKRRMKSDMFGI